MPFKLKDISGNKYGKLTVISLAFMKKVSRGTVSYWNCICDCGQLKVARGYTLKNGGTSSCGCLFKQGNHRSHKMCKTREYFSWSNMINRCNNLKGTHYEGYAKRGINVCDRWLKFENFFEDMGYRPNGMTLDRIDNNQGYYPSNCKWSTQKEQCRNMRRSRFLTLNGITKTMAEWSENTGIKYHTIKARLKYGWSDAETLTL
jgi:hypothetical protein